MNAERHILAKLEGGCQLPLGVLVNERHEGDYHLELFLGARKEGDSPVNLSLSGPDPQQLAVEALSQLGIS